MIVALLTYNAPPLLQEMTNNVRILNLVSVTPHVRFRIDIEQGKH